MSTYHTAGRDLVTAIATAAVLGTSAAGTAEARPGLGDVDCSSRLSHVTIRGNVTVPVDATCNLNRVRISGNVLVQPGGRLTMGHSTVRGNVATYGFVPGESRPSSGARADLTGSTLKGTFTLETGTSGSISDGRVNNISVDGGYYSASINVRNATVGSIQGEGRAFYSLQGATVQESVSGGYVVEVRDSRFRRPAHIGGLSSTVCNSRFDDLVVSSRATTLGDGNQCAGNVVHGDLHLDSEWLTLHNNTIHGDASITDGARTVKGANNTFHGSVPDRLKPTSIRSRR